MPIGRHWRFLPRSLVAGAILALWLPTVAASAGFPPHYQFRHLTPAEGLSQGGVNDIQQDADGFVWLATQDGLDRYDGSTCRIYTNDLDDPRSLSGNGVWCLDLDRRGRLWFGTEDAGFGFYDPATDNFTNFRCDPRAGNALDAYEVVDLLVHPDESIWLATAASGIVRFDPSDSTFAGFDPSSEGTVRVPSEETWALAVDHDGIVWAATSAGLVAFGGDGRPEKVFAHAADDSTSLVADMVYRLHVDSRNRLWVGTIAGLDLLDRATGRFRHFKSSRQDPSTLSGGSIAGIAEGPDGEIWVATMTAGLNVLSLPEGRVRRVGHENQDRHSLMSDSINSLKIDADGLLWVAVDKGADVLDLHAKRFHHVAPRDPLSGELENRTVWSVAEDRNGDVWMGTDDGLYRYGRQDSRMVVYRENSNNPAALCSSGLAFVFSDSRGELWAGSDRQGLSRYDFAHDAFINYGTRPGDNAGLALHRYFGICEGVDRRLWLATMSGLLEYDARADTFIEHGAMAAQLRVVQADSHGKVWLGTWQETLECYDPETGRSQVYRHDPDDPASLSNNVVICMLEDSRQRLWVGTGNGLNLYHRATNTFSRYGVRDGLPNATIYGILEAPDGALWISTNHGLSRFDPDHISCDNYDVSDGLQDDEFNSQSRSSGASGYMYFGGVNGVTMFRPGEIRNSTLRPKLAVTNLQLLNRSVPVGPDQNGRTLLAGPVNRADAIELQHDDRVVTFEFAAFDYVAPQGLLYAYILEGFDPEWHQVVNRRHATYTNLPPGRYTFRVRATNHDGVWSPREARLAVTVTPPLWRTPWFMVLSALGILGTMRGAYTYRTRLMRERNRELEQSVALRTADLEQEIVERKWMEERLRDATDQALAATRAKSEFLANMSHEIRTPLNGVIGLTGALLDTSLDQDQLEYCQMVQSSAGALLNVINDVLDFSKIEVGKLELETIEFHPRDVVDQIGDMLGWQAYEKGLTYAGIVDAAVPAVLLGDPGRLRQVLLNLVGNAVKFTAEGQVEIKVFPSGETEDGKRLIRWEVSDTGVGIPLEKQFLLFSSFSQVDASTTRRYGGTGLGLAISKQLIELMDGCIGCESTAGQGAVFWFELAMTVAVEKGPLPAPDVADKTVMVISCEPHERDVLANHLKHGGRRYCTVHDTAEAVQEGQRRLAAGEQFAAVIVGRLPDREDPADLLGHMCGRDDRPCVPLVLLSDLGDRMEHRQLAERGFKACLGWPVRHRTLFQILDNLAGDSWHAPEESAVAAEPPVDLLATPHLLLAEDNPINQRVAGLILAKLGFTHDVVDNGRDAVAALKRRKYDAVLMDVQMPEMDGLEATRLIRNPASGVLDPQVPILAMTAHAMASDRRRCLDAGMNEHLTKPIRSDAISEALGRYLTLPLHEVV